MARISCKYLRARKNISYKDERDRTDSVKQHVIRLPLQFVMVAPCETIIRLIIATPGTLLLFQAILIFTLKIDVYQMILLTTLMCSLFK